MLFYDQLTSGGVDDETVVVVVTSGVVVDETVVVVVTSGVVDVEAVVVVVTSGGGRVLRASLDAVTFLDWAVFLQIRAEMHSFGLRTAQMCWRVGSQVSWFGSESFRRQTSNLCA